MTILVEWALANKMDHDGRLSLMGDGICSWRLVKF